MPWRDEPPPVQADWTPAIPPHPILAHRHAESRWPGGQSNAFRSPSVLSSRIHGNLNAKAADPVNTMRKPKSRDLTLTHLGVGSVSDGTDWAGRVVSPGRFLKTTLALLEAPAMLAPRPKISTHIWHLGLDSPAPQPQSGVCNVAGRST